MSYLAQNEHDSFSIETSLNEIIATSLIEGVELKRDSRFNQELLSIERIHKWHNAIPKTQIKSSLEELVEYINSSSESFIVKSAVAYLWFESIHPYDDGNGRIGRAILNYILAKDGGLDNRYYSISSAINADRQGYYNSLEKSQNLMYNKNLDITEWIAWHTKSIEKSIDISLHKI